MNTPFEGDPTYPPLIRQIISKHRITTIVETGTQYGASTREFAKMVKRVFTFDVKKLWKGLPHNVTFIQDDSRNIGKHLALNEPTLFFLDAHTQGMYEGLPTDDCPLLDELDAIPKINKGKTIVLVHDFLVPDANSWHATFNGNHVSYDYIKDKLPAIYPNGWTHRYNVEPGKGAGHIGLAIIEPVEAL